MTGSLCTFIHQTILPSSNTFERKLTKIKETFVPVVDPQSQILFHNLQSSLLFFILYKKSPSPSYLLHFFILTVHRNSWVNFNLQYFNFLLLVIPTQKDVGTDGHVFVYTSSISLPKVVSNRSLLLQFCLCSVIPLF